MNGSRSLARVAAFVLPAVLAAGCLQAVSPADDDPAMADAGTPIPVELVAESAASTSVPAPAATPEPEVSEPAAAPVEASTSPATQERPEPLDPTPTPAPPALSADNAADPPQVEGGECHPDPAQALRPAGDLCYGGDGTSP